MNSGSLTNKDYLDFFKSNIIISQNFNINQIQPSSVDLTLSNDCYEINSSFLCPNNKVIEKLDNFIIKKIELKNGHIFKKNNIYLVKLNEKLSISKNIFGKCNPKSSTGRLDIFCRTILDFCEEYEKIPYGYNGDIYLEITSRAFDVILKKGDSLNQMRLIKNKKNILSDLDLLNYHRKNPIIFDSFNNSIKPIISSGLKIGVDLKSNNSVIAYKAKKNCPVLLFAQKKKHKVEDFWEILKSHENSLRINPGEFYILKSQQKIRIPKTMTGEMIPYDTAIGDFRAHYAGFFDPGFGDPNGSYAVLEVRNNEVPFTLEDGQVIATLIYENLNNRPDISYGSGINSNYQNQGLALSKHFNILGYK